MKPVIMKTEAVNNDNEEKVLVSVNMYNNNNNENNEKTNM
jgi:hypothetical protein